LFLDSYNYFATSQFNLAVIIANTALEIFIEEYLRATISEKYESLEQVKDKLSQALKGNLHESKKEFL
jgi:hypothetical protein